MATKTTSEKESQKPAEVAAAVEAAEHQGHPTEGKYWKIFWLLFVITAFEVLLYYVSIPGVNLNNLALGVLAIAKFVVVVGYFMHLKFDSRILRRLFVTGLALAVLVYVAYLLTMGVFISPPDQRP